MCAAGTQWHRSHLHTAGHMAAGQWVPCCQQRDPATWAQGGYTLYVLSCSAWWGHGRKRSFDRLSLAHHCLLLPAGPWCHTS